MVSAAIMAAVLEERQKEHKHCPTCTCSAGDGRANTAAGPGSRGGRDDPRHHDMNYPSGNDSRNSSHQYNMNSSHVGRTIKGTATEVKTVVSDEILNEKGHPPIHHFKSMVHSSILKHQNTSSDSGKRMGNELQIKNCDEITESSPLIDNNSNIRRLDLISKKTSYNKVKLIDLNCLEITEHFNSDNLNELSVDKCICGRPYSISGANVIDVGTQTVPSYIGESGKVHSTCIYCKGQKIKDKHRDKSKKLQRTKEMLSHDSPKLSVCSDGEDVSIISTSEASCCISDDVKKTRAHDSNDSLHNSSVSPMMLGDSACSWDWASQTGISADSGSPSTPSSFCSMAASPSYESGLSSATSPQHMSLQPSCKTTTRQASSTVSASQPTVRSLISSASQSTDLPTLSDVSTTGSPSMINSSINPDVADIRDLIQFTSSPGKKCPRQFVNHECNIPTPGLHTTLQTDNKVHKNATINCRYANDTEPSLLDGENLVCSTYNNLKSCYPDGKSSKLPDNLAHVNLLSECNSPDVFNPLEVSVELLARLTRKVRSFDLSILDTRQYERDEKLGRGDRPTNANSLKQPFIGTIDNINVFNSFADSDKILSNLHRNLHDYSTNQPRIINGNINVNDVTSRSISYDNSARLGNNSDDSPAIHRSSSSKCAPDWQPGVIASTATASATVTSI